MTWLSIYVTVKTKLQGFKQEFERQELKVKTKSDYK